jgi:hypothetical protein
MKKIGAMNKFAWISLAISLALSGCNGPDEAELETASPGISQESAAPEEGADGHVKALAGVCRDGYKTGASCNSNVECGRYCASGPKVNQSCASVSNCGNWCASGSKVNQYCNFNSDCPGSTCVGTTCVQATCS